MWTAVLQRSHQGSHWPEIGRGNLCALHVCPCVAQLMGIHGHRRSQHEARGGNCLLLNFQINGFASCLSSSNKKMIQISTNYRKLYFSFSKDVLLKLSKNLATCNNFSEVIPRRRGQSLILFSENILKQQYRSKPAMQDSTKFPGVLGWWQTLPQWGKTHWSTACHSGRKTHWGTNAYAFASLRQEHTSAGQEFTGNYMISGI